MELRRFVAASASYICYGLKAGQLRVLHRATAARALLRGHTAPVTDLRCVSNQQTPWHDHHHPQSARVVRITNLWPSCSFFPGSEAILASTAKDGQLIVWCISEGADSMLTGQQTLALQLPAPVGGSAPVRLAWHPACRDLLFFSSGSRVLAAHVTELTAAAQQV